MIPVKKTFVKSTFVSIECPNCSAKMTKLEGNDWRCYICGSCFDQNDKKVAKTLPLKTPPKDK